ncbi:MAG: tetratricopeptide repeat protein [Ignavibacteria bacterium]|nr:tetratricopeptide repeat protein [Ignavibacteria bacterium]
MTHDELQSRLSRANAENIKGNFMEAEQLAHSVIAVTDQCDEHHVSALLTIADSVRLKGSIDEAFTLVEDALGLAEHHNHLTNKALAWMMLGMMHWPRGSYDLALDYLGKALVAHETLGKKSGSARDMMNIGIVYAYLGSYEEALEYLGTSIVMYEELSDKSGVAVVTGNIGGVYARLGTYDNALEYFEKALATHRELGEKSLIAGITGNIGSVYYSLGAYDKALEFLGIALSEHVELGAKSAVALVTGNIGGVYADLGLFDIALEYFSKALATHEELGEKSGAAIVIGNIGTLYASQKFENYDPVKAEEFLLRAIAINEDLGTKGQNVDVYKSLAELYENQNRWEAVEYFRKYFTTYQQLQNDEAAKQAQIIDHRRKLEEVERDRQIRIVRFQEQEKILHNILPAHIAERMVAGEKTIADSFEEVTVFFSDIVGFTALSQQVSAEKLVGLLNSIFSQFDQLARKHGLEKIKTMGDSYMAVAGAPLKQDNHAERAALFALDVAEMMHEYRTQAGGQIEIRIGLHSGSVVAGIIGENKLAYDLWGDAVNTASRMESHGETGKIHVSENFVKSVGNSAFRFTERGAMEIKGKGMMKTYFLEIAP